MVWSSIAIGISLFGYGAGSWTHEGLPGGARVTSNGPLHEAFAELVTYSNSGNDSVAVQPPAPLEELPPTQLPSDATGEWIPGYWSFDRSRQEYLWVTGVWRVPPPDCRWVPGYWLASAGTKWTWISGFWTKGDSILVFPTPPASREEGPRSLAKSDQQAWLPGYWEASDDDFSWVDGYWTDGRQGWVWIPRHYLSTPAGAVLAGGYWDYPLDRRGVVFAPISVPPSLASTGFRFQAAAVVPTTWLANHFFLVPSSRHYFFGDFYARSHAQVGILPRHYFMNQRLGYDPLGEYARMFQASAPKRFFDEARREYERLANRKEARPTFDAVVSSWAAGEPVSPEQKLELESAIHLSRLAVLQRQRLDQLAGIVLEGSPEEEPLAFVRLPLPGTLKAADMQPERLLALITDRSLGHPLASVAVVASNPNRSRVKVPLRKDDSVQNASYASSEQAARERRQRNIHGTSISVNTGWGGGWGPGWGGGGVGWGGGAGWGGGRGGAWGAGCGYPRSPLLVPGPGGLATPVWLPGCAPRIPCVPYGPCAWGR